MPRQCARKTKIRINIARFWSGATAEEIVDTILPDLHPYFEFEISARPQVLLYGPYPGKLPTGRFVKVFIGCENLRPIMSECDWAFGVDHEEYVDHPRYMRIQRWGSDAHLIQTESNWEELLRAKTRFCAFVYTRPVFYREALFRALSRYKPVDSPGRSMNNMASIDPIPGQRDWDAKVSFLRSYKFVVAFENSSSPGYNTEKLTHAIEADCIPIYWGDPEIGRSYNVRRFINAHEFLPKAIRFLPRLPYRPYSLRSTGYPGLAGRVARRFNATMAELEQRVWSLAGFDALIEYIIAVDCDDELYLQYLRESFLIDDKPPDRSRWIARWREIFDSALGAERGAAR
jgi:alpha(1,3/1,4) fucosyltransferase